MDNNDLIIVLGGGFIVLIAAFFYVNRMQYEAMYDKFVNSAMSAEANAPASVKENIIEVTNNGLSDSEVTIAKDSAVRFINQTDMPITIEASDHSFSTKMLQQGESDVVTFAMSGTVTYIVKEQPSLKGIIKVLE